MIALLVAGCTRPSVPDLRADAALKALPARGTLKEVDWGSFEAIISGLRGKIVVVNVWASWCTPCRAEAPTLEMLASSLAPKAQVLGLVAQDDPRSAEAFVAEFGLSFANVIDSTGDITDRLRMQGFPTTYVFDATGRLRPMIFGGISERRLVAAVQDAER
jgi:cytochrome c biogenesis protein CcmG/thiol:disulfide interchange protein DsbE